MGWRGVIYIVHYLVEVSWDAARGLQQWHVVLNHYSQMKTYSDQLFTKHTQWLMSEMEHLEVLFFRTYVLTRP